MGLSPSKKIDHFLESSIAFQQAVATTFQECVALSQHSFSGICAYQLLDASMQIYQKISSNEDAMISQYMHAWLPQPPSQVEVDETIQRQRLFEEGRKALDLQEFSVFATSLFRDKCLATACHRLVVYAPAGGLGVLAAHLVASRLPYVKSVYRGSGPLLPGLLLGTVAAAVFSVYSKLG